jgi:hypothetical protein
MNGEGKINSGAQWLTVFCWGKMEKEMLMTRKIF